MNVVTPTAAGTTMPVGEQIRFLSARTGAWVLDTYLEAAELGNRTIADLLADLFDSSGQLVLSGLNNWMGFWQAGQEYRPGDTFKNSTGTTAYVTLRIHFSSSIPGDLAAGNIDQVIGAVVGPQGPPGPIGPVGPQGPAGQTVKVIGSFGLVKTPADLPPSGLIPINWDGAGRPATAHQFLSGEGMSYLPLNQTDPLYSHLYSFVGTSVVPSGWADVGAAEGPPGNPGPPGGSYVVVAHLDTAPPDVNNPPIDPPFGLLVVDLDDTSHGQASIPAGGTTGQFLAKLSNTSYDTQWQTQNVGPQGPQGPQGPTGPQGPQGTPGQDSTLLEAPNDANTYGRHALAWTPVLPIAGGTMTGALFIAPPSGNPVVYFDGAAGTNRVIQSRTAGSPRWNFLLANATAESGSNTGSDFSIQRCGDNGIVIDTPFVINRASGQVKVTIAGNALANQPHLDSLPGTVKGWYGSVNGSERWGVVVGNSLAESTNNAGSDFSINAFSDAAAFLGSPLYITRATGAVTITGYGSTGTLAGASGNATLQLSKRAGAFTNNIQGIVGGLLRWQLQLGNGAAESTGNVGSDFIVNRYNDAGTVIDNPFSINRATGAVTLTGTLNGVGASFSGTVSVGTLTLASLATGAITCTTLQASSNVQVVAGANAAWYYATGGSNQWNWGVSTDGNFYIQDTGSGTRFYCTSAGACVATGDMTVSGNFNTNQITGTLIFASSAIRLNTVAGVTAWYQSFVAGARQWQFGCYTDGNFYIQDTTVTRNCVRIDTGGTVNLTALAVSGVSTLTGSVACNTISCSTINTNGNGITATGATITCGALVAQVGATTAAVQVVNNVRNWSMRCLVTSGNFDIADNTAGAQRLIIGTDGTVSVLQALAVGATCDVGSTGVGYTGLSAKRFAFNNSGTTLTFYVNGAATGQWAFSAPSDERLKENIAAPEGDALAELLDLRLISYDMKDGSGHRRYGFSAQQMDTIIPEAVQRSPMGFRNYEDEPATEEELMLSVDVMPLIARLVGAVQQMAKRIQILEGAQR
jgi:hypothetical protein